MVEVPLFALGLQPGGCMTRAKAQHYIDNCRSRRKYYRVLVMESGPRAPESLQDTADISQWAYERAVATLMQCPDAVAGIGLQSNLIRLFANGRIIPVRMAAAALVRREQAESPILIVTSNANLDDQAKLVGQALSAWRSHAPRDFGYRGPIIQAVARDVVYRH